MASLNDLLTQDGFRRRKPHKPTNPKTQSIDPDRRSLDRHPRRTLRPNGSPTIPPNITHSRSLGSKPTKPNPQSIDPDRRRLDRHPRRTLQPNGFPNITHTRSLPSNSDPHPLLTNDEPAIDNATIQTIVSILSGYAGRFLKDSAFRHRVREKCAACLAASKGAAHGVLANLELGIESTERLAEEAAGGPRESKIRSLRNSIRLLSVVVAALNSPRSRIGGGYTCGVPNSHLTACAQLYLSIVYRIKRNNRASASHLLQVFCDAPYMARRNLLPDLWEHFFVPHLLHLKVWYSKEVELIAGWDTEVRGQRVKHLDRDYNDQMDSGTAQFALYYKEWLKAGAKAPPLPSISLPSRPSSIEPLRKRSVSVPPGFTKRTLYQSVFGPSLEHGDTRDGVSIDEAKPIVEREADARERSCKLVSSVHNDVGVHQRQSNSVQECPVPEAAVMPRKSYSFRLLSCHSDPTRAAICHSQIFKDVSATIAREPNINVSSIDLGRAISLISNSDRLGECENAIRVVAKVWLDSHGDSIVEAALSTSSVIEGLLEVASTSKDAEVLEFAISILAELVARNEINRQIVLIADPQLEIFLRLLRSKSLFLKAAVLLYLLTPKAKQMLSQDWVPFVLHVLQYGDQMQTLFSVRCSPKSAAFYLLDQLLTGFDVDRNVENAKQVVALGGLDLLIRRLQIGDAREKKTCASLLASCVRGDGSCRHYLAGNIKESIIQMLLGNRLKSKGIALSLLCELLCLDRITKIIKFLNGLKSDGCLNTMHVLLVYLQQAPLEQRPLVAVIILQLDLLGDPLNHSIYRKEGIDAILAALEHNLLNKKLQEQCSRALLLLGSRFSCEGEAMAEAWLLKRAGLNDGPADLFNTKEIIADEIARLEEEEEEKATEDWLSKLALILLTSGNKRFLVALSNCIADGIPSLARSCLVTVAWMSSTLSSLHNANTLSTLACSILAPRLVVSLNYDRAVEDRVLASLSLLNFIRHPGCLPKLFPFDKETVGSLQDLAKVTWTAKELLFACCR